MEPQKSRACGCCGGSDTILILSAPDRAAERVDIFHCKSCSALTPGYPPLSQRETNLAQQTAFHERFWRSESDAELQHVADQMADMVAFFSNRLPNAGSQDLVYDIGAGRGNLTAALLRAGLNAVACEPSRPLAERAMAVLKIPPDRLSIVTAHEFLDARSTDRGSVKAIFLWHVLEHVDEPIALLRRLRNYLAPDGVLLCQGPLLDPQYVYPEHLYLHSESNIRWLAEQADLKPLVMNSNLPTRFVSFTLALPDHPDPPCSIVNLSDPLLATGALYNTLSTTLSLLRERVS
jgi:SAM-dependent methyltransferase